MIIFLDHFKEGSRPLTAVFKAGQPSTVSKTDACEAGTRDSI